MCGFQYIWRVLRSQILVVSWQNQFFYITSPRVDLYSHQILSLVAELPLNCDAFTRAIFQKDPIDDKSGLVRVMAWKSPSWRFLKCISKLVICDKIWENLNFSVYWYIWVNSWSNACWIFDYLCIFQDFCPLSMASGRQQITFIINSQTIRFVAMVKLPLFCRHDDIVDDWWMNRSMLTSHQSHRLADEGRGICWLFSSTNRILLYLQYNQHTFGWHRVHPWVQNIA